MCDYNIRYFESYFSRKQITDELVLHSDHTMTRTIFDIGLIRSLFKPKLEMDIKVYLVLCLGQAI